MMLKTAIISIMPQQLAETKEEADLESLTSSLSNNKGDSEKPEAENTVEEVEDVPNLDKAINDKQYALTDYLVDMALYNEVQNIKDNFRRTGLLDEETMRMYEGELEKRILLHLLQEMNNEQAEERELPFYMYDDEEEEAVDRFKNIDDLANYFKDLGVEEGAESHDDEVVNTNEKSNEDLNEDYLKLLDKESKSEAPAKNVQVVEVNGNEQKDAQKAKKDEVIGSSNKETV
ncbi:DgyrCDS3570 [Dimorphilus gyrociliatus]|uniref:DgyrCDS3570 n=1 Tax=Dimorphilus gyrociliatus TaxID=2664684 RepID=A0A7I8VFI5_9ANNE|nr:DgyrCDS3570 [Dimorphilus gyrociliatus]